MTKRETAQLLITLMLGAVVAVVLLWSTYSLFAHGVDSRRQFFEYTFITHAWVSVPSVLALLALAVWQDWKHYRRTGALAGFTPFRAFAAVVSLLLFVWVSVDGI